MEGYLRAFRVACAILAWVLSLPALAADEAHPAFEAANRLYEQGQYSEAVSAYQGILEGGRQSAAIYFNLGNAFFKSGQIGRAILNYRKAEQLAPRDPDIRGNLRFARNTVAGGSAVEPGIWRSTLSRFTLNEWGALASISIWICFGLLALAQLKPSLAGRLKTSKLTSGVLAGALVLLTGVAWSVERGSRTAVVIVPQAVVRYGPLDESQSYYVVHDGAELAMLDSKDDWIQVSVASGRVGWVREEQVASFPD